MDTKLNRSDYILISIIYAVSTLFNSWDYYKSGNALIEYLVDFPVAITISFGVIWIFMYWLIPKFLVETSRYFHFVFFGVLILVVGGIIEKAVGFWSGGNQWSEFPNWYNLIINGLFTGSDNVGITFGLLLTKKFYESQTKIANIQQQQKENELKLLRSQIDPHFLFNNLNTLDALIDSDTEKAKEYINRLSLIYRYLIKTKDAEVMELAEEVALAENYIFLIKTRFGEDYDIQIEKKATLKDRFIPTGSLQTLLENVVKHNKASANDYVKARINIEEDRLEITNNKSKLLSREESFGTGLENLKARYKFLSDKEVLVVNTASQFKVSIPIIKLSKES